MATSAPQRTLTASPRSGSGPAKVTRPGQAARTAAPGARGDVDAAALAASEGRARRDVEGADDGAAQRPVPVVRVGGGGSAGDAARAHRAARQDHREHEHAPEGEGGEDERMRARGHATEATARMSRPEPAARDLLQALRYFVSVSAR